jgi:ABC-2 type transport system permease protein
MINKRIWPVIRREVRTKLHKGFIISTIFIPLIMGAIVGIQGLLANLKTEDPAQLTLLVENNPALKTLIADAISQADPVKSGLYKVEFKQLPLSEFKTYIETRRQDLIDDDTRSIITVPNTALVDKKISLYSANPSNGAVRNVVVASVNKAFNLNFFATNRIENVDIRFIQTDVGVEGNKVTESGTQAESLAPIIIGGSMALLLLLGITFNSMPLMNIVVSEKQNRVYEVLLSSLKPTDLLWGKIIGTVAVATLQMLIWVTALTVLVMMMNNFVAAGDEFHADFRPGVMLYYVVNYQVGLLIFLSLYAGLSSMYENASAASSSLMPIYFIILLPFYTVFALLGNPANSVAALLSMIPLTSLYVMPARMLLIDVPIWQPALALALNVGVLYFANLIAAKIYRVSVLAAGTSPSLRQIAIWVRKN